MKAVLTFYLKVPILRAFKNLLSKRKLNAFHSFPILTFPENGHKHKVWVMS